MQIIINEEEILEAIKGYITKQGIVTAGREITVELTAGRGPNGSRATVEITKPDGEPTVHEVFASNEEKAVEEDIAQVEEVVEKAAKEKPEVESPTPEPTVEETKEDTEPNADATGVFELPEDEAPAEEVAPEPAEAVGGDALFGF